MFTTNRAAAATRPNPKFATELARLQQRERRLADLAQPAAGDQKTRR